MTVVGTAGHVDHGKSSLVLALTGTDPDRFAEEQRRGLTIDLGFAHAALPSGAVISLIDVPGHVRFLRNMLAGVGGIDACLFVVAATEGWKPQSEEHLRILQLLGLRDGVVALTKVDLVDDEWRELQTLEVLDRLAGTFLEGAPVVPVSAHTGEGLDRLCHELDLLLARTTDAIDRGRPRLWIDRSFAAKGSGTVVTGTLTDGSLHVDQRIDVLPAGRSARIRSMQQHGAPIDVARPGSRVALNLGGVDHHEIGRGDAVVVAAQWRPTRRVDATLDVLAAARPRRVAPRRAPGLRRQRRATGQDAHPRPRVTGAGHVRSGAAAPGRCVAAAARRPVRHPRIGPQRDRGRRRGARRRPGAPGLTGHARPQHRTRRGRARLDRGGRARSDRRRTGAGHPRPLGGRAGSAGRHQPRRCAVAWPRPVSSGST